MPTEAFKFECTLCGKCCRWGGWVCLYPDDVTRLTAYKAISTQEFIDRYTMHIAVEYKSGTMTTVVPYLALKSIGDTCILLEDNLCSVHEAKPVHCSASPLLAEFLLDDSGWEQFSTGCDGMNQGPVITRPEIDQALMQQAERDMVYEADLEKHGWDLGVLLAVNLPKAELIPEIGFEVEIEE